MHRKIRKCILHYFFTPFCLRLLIFLSLPAAPVWPACLHNFPQSISSIISSMLTEPMTGLKNSSARALALMYLSRKRVLFSWANLMWCPLCVILMWSLSICWVPHWSPWMYFTHCRPGRPGGEKGRPVSLLEKAYSASFARFLNTPILPPPTLNKSSYFKGLSRTRIKCQTRSKFLEAVLPRVNYHIVI